MLNHSVHHKTTDIDPIVGSRTPVGLVTTARLSDHVPDLEMLGSHDGPWLSDPDLYVNTTVNASLRLLQPGLC